MKTTQLNKADIKRINRLAEGILRDFAHTLLENGFRILVYIPTDSAPVKWITFEKDGKMGQCSLDFGGGLRFSTMHKPNIKIGTGYSIQDQYAGIYEPTIENAFEALAIKPNWAYSGINSHDPQPVKYKGLEDYFKTPTNQILKYDIIQL